MNKIILDEEKIDLVIEENEEIFLEQNNCKEKIINIYINSNVNTIINEIECLDINVTYNYFLKEDAKLTVNKFYNSKLVDETINIYLEGKKSDCNLNISCISKNNHYYKINVFHNNKSTLSNTSIHGITLSNEKITVENNGHVKKGNSKCVLNQDNKIITLFKNNSTIKPNLYIDEYDVEASHGAYIGNFLEETLFYMQSRGINKEDCTKLLVKGFLLNNLQIKEDMKNYVDKIINDELEVK